ncbi:unnamed protein product [Allacma fusca]|uniref:Thyroglobulin type-1 domain-containing protein n=1 Tax=Allacma fusca TaxID=39272 RepID=A0A8J2P6K3_9HEXA|nr:unnamed protein product [Allacma fusca]
MGKKTWLVPITLLLFTLTCYSISWSQVQAKGQVCPLMLKKLLGSSETCEKLKCKSNLKPEDCSDETTFQENIDSCGCCPACVRVKEIQRNAECGKDTATYEECGKKICPIEIKECEKGFHCSEDSKTCVAIEDNPLPDPTMSCAMKLTIAKKDGWEHYMPSCNPDGTYASKQCKGIRGKYDAACFCTTDKGERIFGRKQWTEKTEETMDCACSLHVHKLRSKGLLTTIHCTYDGSYEKLQCDGESGLCYCVDPKSGEMTGAVLPEFQWKDLPCYSEDLGDKYLRQCESHWLATERINIEASIHGLTLVKFGKVDCDYDGSFKRYARTGNIESCAHKNGVQMTPYYRQRQGNEEDMNCNCARLYIDYETEGLTIPTNAPDCSKTTTTMGNFETVQSAGERASSPIAFMQQTILQAGNNVRRLFLEDDDPDLNLGLGRTYCC